MTNAYSASLATAEYDGTRITIKIDGTVITESNKNTYGSGGNPNVSSDMQIILVVPSGKSVGGIGGSTISAGGIIVASFDGTGYVLDTAQYINYTFTLADVTTVKLEQGGDGNQWPSIAVSPVSGGGGGKGGGAGAPCFFGNAPVLTPTGYRRMDSLREGDLVSTPGGTAVPIQRVKVYRCEAGPATNPYVIQKGQFGATKRLLISPRHRVATATGMVEAQELGLAREERVGELTYYNLGLPGWVNMVVAGVEVESLAPVQRIVVPVGVFKALVAKKHGAALTPALMAKIQSTCRFLENGMVECPVMKH
jgi:hypothetical protein